MIKQIKGALPCFLAALIWGLSFVVQTTAMEDVGGFTFTGVRMALAVLVLIPAALISEKRARKKQPPQSDAEKAASRKTLWTAGAICGFCLFVGINLQQFAFIDTPAGKVGFLTAMYMILVPILGTLLFRKKIMPLVWFSVLLAAFGIFLLCLRKGEQFSFGRGELLSLSCSIFFATQILFSDRYATRVNVISLSCLQFAIAGALSIVCMFVFERPTLPAILSAAPEILYAGVLSSAGAFTLQLYGQKNTEPVLASMLLCLESVFASIFGWLLLGQAMSARELFGCTIMFIAIMLTLIPREIWQSLFHINSKQKG
ncbi:MAG: DMT family transporter [Clostridia bacterium]|nr:DMT family transporter [Clostridia bacterium]